MKTPIEYIKEAIKIYSKKENFIFFAKIMAVLVIISTSLNLIINYFYPVNIWQDLKFDNIQSGIIFAGMSLLAIFVGLWIQTTTYFSILNTGSNELKVLKTGFKNLFKYLFMSFIYGLIVLVGAILLLIPAIIFGIWYSFSIFLILDKNLSPQKALQSSKKMVKGKFFAVFGRFIVFGLFSFVVTLLLSPVPYAGSILVSFLAPLFLLPSYLLYRDLSVD